MLLIRWFLLILMLPPAALAANGCPVFRAATALSFNGERLVEWRLDSPNGSAGVTSPPSTLTNHGIEFSLSGLTKPNLAAAVIASVATPVRWSIAIEEAKKSMSLTAGEWIGEGPFAISMQVPDRKKLRGLRLTTESAAGDLLKVEALGLFDSDPDPILLRLDDLPLALLALVRGFEISAVRNQEGQLKITEMRSQDYVDALNAGKRLSNLSSVSNAKVLSLRRDGARLQILVQEPNQKNMGLLNFNRPDLLDLLAVAMAKEIPLQLQIPETMLDYEKITLGLPLPEWQGCPVVSPLQVTSRSGIEWLGMDPLQGLILFRDQHGCFCLHSDNLATLAMITRFRLR